MLEKFITLSFMTSQRGWPQKYNLLSFLYNLGLFVNAESTSTITLSHLFMPHIQAQDMEALDISVIEQGKGKGRSQCLDTCSVVGQTSHGLCTVSV